MAPMDNPERAVLVEQMALQAPAILLDPLLAGYLVVAVVPLIIIMVKVAMVVPAAFASSGPETQDRSHQQTSVPPDF